MKVWILERGCYEEKYVVGLYVSSDLAIRENPVVIGPKTTVIRPGGWQQDKSGNWDNGLDWSQAERLFAMEVRGS